VLLQHLTRLGLWSGVEPEQELRACAARSFATSMDASWQLVALRFLEQAATGPRGPIPAIRKARARSIDHLLAVIPSVIPTAAASTPGEPAFRYKVGDNATRRAPPTSARSRADRVGHGKCSARASLGHCGESSWPAQAGECLFSRAASWEFVAMLREMTALVRPAAKKAQTRCRRWAGGSWRSPICSPSHLRSEVHRLRRGHGKQEDPANSGSTAPSFTASNRLLRPPGPPSPGPSPPGFSSWSKTCPHRDGSHLFAFPFEGAFVHGRAGLSLGWPLDAPISRNQSTVSVNDYGRSCWHPAATPSRSGECHSESMLDGAACSGSGSLDQSSNLSPVASASSPRWRRLVSVNGFLAKARAAATADQRRPALWSVRASRTGATVLLEQAMREVDREQLEKLVGPAPARNGYGPAACLLEKQPGAPGPLAFPCLWSGLKKQPDEQPKSVLERLGGLVAESPPG